MNGEKDKETYSIVVSEHKYIILPDDLDIKAKLNDEIRSRGIYKSSVYTGNLNMVGNFSNLHNKIEDSKDEMRLKKLYIFIGVSNTNSLEKINKFAVGEKNIILESGTGLKYPLEFGKGVAGNLDIYEDTRLKILKFDINFDLRGSGEINVLPLGRNNYFEISSKKETHYIQYGVVGISLTLFYLVLLSFSEHMSFGGAYILATVAMAIPNALYMKSITKSIKYGIGMFVFLVAIYSILFSILQMEEYALITGVLLVLFILYVIMYLTRNLDNIEY